MYDQQRGLKVARVLASRMLRSDARSEGNALPGLQGPAADAMLFSAIHDYCSDGTWFTAAGVALRSACGAPCVASGLLTGWAGNLLAIHSALGSRAVTPSVVVTTGQSIVRFAKGYHEAQPLSTYDLVDGFSGAAATLAFVQGRKSEIDWVAALNSPLTLVERKLAQLCVRGRMDLGLAHGVAGILGSVIAFQQLARSMEQRKRFEKLVFLIGEKLCEGITEVAGGPRWPSFQGGAVSGSPLRWCYGSIGVAVQLWKAGDAVEYPRFSNIALTVMDSVFGEANAEALLDEFGICHGISGAALLADVCFEISGIPKAAEMRNQLLDELIDAFDPALPYGYWESRHTKLKPLSRRDFYGVAGIALVLCGLCGKRNPALLTALGLLTVRGRS